MLTLTSFAIIRRLHLLIVLAIVCLLAASAHAQSRRKITVLRFDDSTAGTRDMNIGAKVADVLLSKLAAGGAFEVVDRDHLAAIMATQDLKLDSRFDPDGAARIGKLVNVDALIVGQVNAFNANVAVETKRNFVSNKQTSVGTIELRVTARVISVETGSILFAPTASVEQKQVLAESSSSNLVQGVSSSASTDVHSALMKLVDKSVNDISQNLSGQIIASNASIPGAHGIGGPAAKVVGLEDGLVLANRGTNAGIKVGDKFAVVRLVDTGLKDPDTGKAVVRRKRICMLSIAESEDSVCSGKCDGDVPQAGDELTPPNQ